MLCVFINLRAAPDDYLAIRSQAMGLPIKHGDTGAYIMWAGSPYAYVHVMGRS
jgi:hypothetical protein